MTDKDAPKDPLDIYKSESKQVDDLLGFLMNAPREGEKASVMREAFLTSFDQIQSKIMLRATQLFVNDGEINSLLIVIRDGVARIYRKFPITLLVRLKTNTEAFHAIFKHQILDIEGVQFKDIYFDLEIRDSDKFLWLFRSGFNFGLYFDFSGNLLVTELSAKLGHCYRKLEYFSIYSYFQESSNSNALIAKGWFPFIQLIGDDLERLIEAKSNETDVVAEGIVRSFTKEKIESFSSYWWSNPIFSKKKSVLNAGIQAFISNTDVGNINCIKNLILEIEGIIRLSFFDEHKKSPRTEEIKRYLLTKASEKFSNANSFGFPLLFATYLDNVIFRKFDLQSGNIDFSRNSVGHGVASEDLFTRTRALQCILTLDQIYFYLGGVGSNTKKD